MKTINFFCQDSVSSCHHLVAIVYASCNSPEGGSCHASHQFTGIQNFFCEDDAGSMECQEFHRVRSDGIPVDVKKFLIT